MGSAFARLGSLAFVGLFSLIFSPHANADGMTEAASERTEDARKFTYTLTAGAATEYIFRGVSQTDEDPSAQGSIDLSYGIFYAGIWSSNVDFNDVPPATAEVDFYGGIKPVWGAVTFDLGVIYYAYPNAGEAANFINETADLEFVELKAGYSLAWPTVKNLTTGTTLYYSPEYSLDTGDVFTIENTASYVFPAIGKVTPTVSGTFAAAFGDSSDGFSVGGTSEDDYLYWNAGVSLAIEKFTFDFRYWDTDIDVVGAGGTVCAAQDLCDASFVALVKVALP